MYKYIVCQAKPLTVGWKLLLPVSTYFRGRLLAKVMLNFKGAEIQPLPAGSELSSTGFPLVHYDSSSISFSALCSQTLIDIFCSRQ